jgi:hypothetical protein
MKIFDSQYLDDLRGKARVSPRLRRKLPQIENNMKIEASISLRRRDEEVKVQEEPDCWNLG